MKIISLLAHQVQMTSRTQCQPRRARHLIARRYRTLFRSQKRRKLWWPSSSSPFSSWQEKRKVFPNPRDTRRAIGFLCSKTLSTGWTTRMAEVPRARRSSRSIRTPSRQSPPRWSCTNKALRTPSGIPPPPASMQAARTKSSSRSMTIKYHLHRRQCAELIVDAPRKLQWLQLLQAKRNCPRSVQWRKKRLHRISAARRTGSQSSSSCRTFSAQLLTSAAKRLRRARMNSKRCSYRKRLPRCLRSFYCSRTFVRIERWSRSTCNRVSKPELTCKRLWMRRQRRRSKSWASCRSIKR